MDSIYLVLTTSTAALKQLLQTTTPGRRLDRLPLPPPHATMLANRSINAGIWRS